jgi:FkbM family methyltransferase
MRFLTLEGPDGHPFEVDVTDGGFGGYAMGGWGEAEIAGVVRMLPEDAICVDVGANWGVWTRMLSASAARGFVHAFEPSPATFQLLQRNCRSNRNVECIQAALGSQPGTVSFSDESVAANLRRIEPSGLPRSSIARCDSLVSFLSARNLGRLDFLKVDVEGFEAEVIMPGLEMLRVRKTLICFEYIKAFDGRSTKHPASRLFDDLPMAGYQIYRLDSTGRHWPLHDGRGTSSNYLAIYSE